jgi:DNA-binding NarL/FixJ family response regulator
MEDFISYKDFSSTQAAKHFNLTEREVAVVKNLSKGHTNKEIARLLNLSYRTVDAHRASIMRKMYANNTATLVASVVNFDLQGQLEARLD